MKGNKMDYVIVQLYVDDVISNENIKAIKRMFSRNLEMKNLSVANLIFGMQLLRRHVVVFC